MKNFGSRWLFTMNLLNFRVTASTLLTPRTSSKYSSLRKFISSVCLLGLLAFNLWSFSGQDIVSAVTECCVLRVCYFERDLLNTAETPDVKYVLKLEAM